MTKRRVLIVNAHPELRSSLEEFLDEPSHEIVFAANRDEALGRPDLDSFDLIITDLDEDAAGGIHILNEMRRRRLLVPVVLASDEAGRDSTVKAFRVGAANFLSRPYDINELRNVVEETLAYKLRFVEDLRVLPHVRECIEFNLPSDLKLMDGVLHYLLERVARLGIVRQDGSNLYIALDEAFVNAVVHGNKSDPKKIVRVTAELTAKEARFTIEDEGDGFDRASVPDPRDPANLFKSSGRGVLLIHNIMDEVEYNERGNRLTMVKRADDDLQTALVEKIASETNGETFLR